MTTSPGQAKRIVIVSLATGGALAALGDVGSGRGLPRITIGIGVVVSAALLSAVAEVAPKPAAAFAVLAAAGAVLGSGAVGQGLETVQKLTSQPEGETPS